MAALEGGDLDRFIELIHLAIAGPSQEVPEAVERSARRLERVVRRMGVRTVAADYRPVTVHDLTGRLGGLDMPVAGARRRS